jgi:hypothetical protein
LHRGTYSETVTTRLKRTGHLIEVEDPDVTVTFHPTNIDKTYDAIISKCKELYPGYPLTEIQFRDIDVQLAEIYKDYDEGKNKRWITEAEHLVNLAMSQIKLQFKDQTGAFYAVIERNNHDELVNMNSEEFSRYLSKLYYGAENRVINKNTINNSKRLLESFTTETRTLNNRVAKIGNIIYYDLNNEEWQCIKITEDGWEIVENPLLFYRGDPNRVQVQPRLPFAEITPTDRNRRWVRDLVDKFFIKYDFQRIIAEIYIISLFISDISHPIILPTGPRASGKTLLLRCIRQIVDPRPFSTLVERLPRDDKDRRVSILNSYLACFDNESHLNPDLMDEICTWVTGFSMSVRELYTTDEMRTFSAQRALGITGINIPITNSDALDRAFIVDMESVPDGSDENSESKLISENKFIAGIKSSVPDILEYIFNVLVKSLERYDEVERQIRPNHRLADFVIWGETISRVIGNKHNEFLQAWYQNTQQQNINVVQNDPFAELLIEFILNHCQENEFRIEPQHLLINLKHHAETVGIRHDRVKWFPQRAVWVSRKIKTLIKDLKVANILVDPDVRKDQKRWIYFKKLQRISIGEYTC